MGEEAVDTGGPSREFWRLIMYEIKDKFCRGKEGCMVFDRNTPALQVIYSLINIIEHYNKLFLRIILYIYI